MKTQINIDMDGTFVDLYNVDGWLEDIEKKSTRPYEIAKPLVNMSSFAKQIHRLQKNGYDVNIITCGPKGVYTKEKYNAEVEIQKRKWLKKHLPSVKFNKIIFLPYGSNKALYGEGILFDDEPHNRVEWEEKCRLSFTEENLLETLKKFK